MRIAQIADGCDMVATDCDVACKPWIPRAIDDVAIVNEEVVSFSGARNATEVCIIRGTSNFAEGLARNGLCGIHVWRKRNVIDVCVERQFPAIFCDHVANQTFAIEHQLAVELVFGAERARLCKHVTGGG